ncbi:hypothetical protein ABVT39_021357 [Epinephelus coioides]
MCRLDVTFDNVVAMRRYYMSLLCVVLMCRLTTSLLCVVTMCRLDVVFDNVVAMRRYCIVLMCHLTTSLLRVFAMCRLTTSLLCVVTMCRLTTSLLCIVTMCRLDVSFDNVLMPGYRGGTGRPFPGLPFAVGGGIRICTLISPIAVARDTVSTDTHRLPGALCLQRKSIPTFCRAGRATSLLHCCVPLIKVPPLQQVTRNHKNT